MLVKNDYSDIERQDSDTFYPSIFLGKK